MPVSLLSDPKMLARVMEEQQRVMKDASAPLTWENLGEMELLHNCMREALRVCAPVVRSFCSKPHAKSSCLHDARLITFNPVNLYALCSTVVLLALCITPFARMFVCFVVCL